MCSSQFLRGRRGSCLSSHRHSVSLSLHPRLHALSESCPQDSNRKKSTTTSCHSVFLDTRVLVRQKRTEDRNAIVVCLGSRPRRGPSGPRSPCACPTVLRSRGPPDPAPDPAPDPDPDPGPAPAPVRRCVEWSKRQLLKLSEWVGWALGTAQAVTPRRRGRGGGLPAPSRGVCGRIPLEGERDNAIP